MSSRRRAAAAAPIDEVAARMEAIADRLPPDDGVARFNDLYLAVTREVAREARATAFEDVEFVAELDVAFAGLFFAADDAVEAGRLPSRAWRPLFEARSRRRVAPIQFALCGMNAHINYDLALALVSTHDRAGLKLRRRSAQHRDYVRVNAILDRVERKVKKRFATGLVGVADEALGRVDDVVAMWSVARARDTAWAHAETLWAIRDLRALRESFLLALSRMVGLAGRGLLVPTL